MQFTVVNGSFKTMVRVYRQPKTFEHRVYCVFCGVIKEHRCVMVGLRLPLWAACHVKSEQCGGNWVAEQPNMAICNAL